MKQKRIAFLFPGQGAQYAGMGADFFEAFPLARETFEQADHILDRSLSRLIFEGPQEKLTETQNSQPAIYVTSIALLRVLQEQLADLKPFACAGHSLGEYSAITASGRLSFEDCLPLVQARANYMSEACEKNAGGMAAVIGLSADEVEESVRDLKLPNDLWVANLNCPGQVVISGTKRGIERGAEALKIKGARRVMPLQVHGAFHSGLMKEAEDRLGPYIQAASIVNSEVVIVMNVTGNVVEEPSQVKDLLTRQVTSSVRWQDGMQTLNGQGIDLYVEIGCGKVLSGLNKRIGVAAPTVNVDKLADLENLAKTLETVLV